MSHGERQKSLKRTEPISSNSELNGNETSGFGPQESLRALSSVFERSPVGNLLFSPDGLLLSINASALQIFGMPSESAGLLIGCYNILNDQKLPDEISRVIKRGFQSESVEFSNDVLSNDGMLQVIGQDVQPKSIWASGSIYPVMDDSGQSSAVILEVRDTSDAKREEDELRSNEERFRILSMATFEGIVLLVGRYAIDVNEAFEKMTGYDRSEIVGTDGQFMVTPESLIAISEHLATGSSEPYEVDVIRKDGSIVPVEVIGRSIEFKGRTIRVTATRDITERKIAEEALRESEERFKSFFESSPVGLAVFDADLRYISVNKTLADMISIPVAEHIGRTPSEVLSKWPKRIPRRVESILKSVIETGEPVVEAEVVGEGHRKTARNVLVTAFPLVKVNGEVKSVGNVVIDITDRKRTEEALRQSEARFRILADSAFEGLIIHYEGVFLDINDACLKMMGYKRSEILGTNVADYLTPESTTKVMSHVRAGSEEPYEIEIIRKDGTTFPAEVRGRAMYYKGISARVSYVRDISERKKAEDELRQSEARFRTLADSAFEGLVIHDYKTIYDVNSAFIKMTGFERQQLLGKNPGDFLSKESLEVILSHAYQSLEEPYEVTILRKDGTSFPAEIHSRDIDYKGIKARIGSIRDISERKQAEDALLESEERFRVTFENAAIGMTILNEEGRITAANPAIEKMLGYERDALLGVIPIEFTHPDDRKSDLKLFNDVIDGKIVSYKKEKRLIRRDGEVVWVRVTASGIRLREQSFVVAMTEDITERKKAEAELQMLAAELENRVHERTAQLEAANLRLKELEFIVNKSSSVAFLWKAQEGWPVEYVSENVVQFGYTPDDLMSGRIKYASIIHKDDIDRIANELEYYAAENKNEFIQEYRILAASGELRWVEDNTWVRRDSDGRITHYQGIILDVTKRKQAEEERMERTLQLEELNKEMEAFSYSVSHDLRSPLRSIDGFSLALIEDYIDKFDPQGKDYLQRIRTGAQRMGMLIDDMLRLSRLSRSEMSIEDIDLSAMANQIASDLKEREPDRFVNFVIEPGMIIKGDKNLMRMALENLMDNAWKFTSKVTEAIIQVGLTCHDDESVYFVKDNGAGFDMSYAPKLFTPFQRLHSVTDFPGSGIGLAIVRRVIHRHEGRIWAESSVGQGAAFYFTIGLKSGLASVAVRKKSDPLS